MSKAPYGWATFRVASKVDAEKRGQAEVSTLAAEGWRASYVVEHRVGADPANTNASAIGRCDWVVEVSVLGPLVAGKAIAEANIPGYLIQELASDDPIARLFIARADTVCDHPASFSCLSWRGGAFEWVRLNAETASSVCKVPATLSRMNPAEWPMSLWRAL